MYPDLNFPEVDIALIKKGDTFYVYDPIRKKDIILQPEEWVRQHVILYLAKYKSFPINLMTEELSVNYGKLKKRIDLLIYDINLKPLMLAEFKSYNIALSNETFLQAAVYNRIIKAPYLLISNGIKTIATQVDFTTSSISYLEETPDFKDIIY